MYEAHRRLVSLHLRKRRRWNDCYWLPAHRRDDSRRVNKGSYPCKNEYFYWAARTFSILIRDYFYFFLGIYAEGVCQILVCVQRSAILVFSHLTLLFSFDYLFFSSARYISALFLSGNMMTNVVIDPPTGWQFFLSIFARCNAPSHFLLIVLTNDNIINNLLSFCWVIFFFSHFATKQCFLPLRNFFCQHVIKHTSYNDTLDFW